MIRRRAESSRDVPDLNADDARRAIDAAHQAFPAWAAKPAKDRVCRFCAAGSNSSSPRRKPLAQLMTAEQGKPLAKPASEVAYGASFVEWFAEEGKRAYGHTIPTTGASRRYRHDQAADRRLRGDHAVEFPDCDDHAQGQ